MKGCVVEARRHLCHATQKEKGEGSRDAQGPGAQASVLCNIEREAEGYRGARSTLTGTCIMQLRKRGRKSKGCVVEVHRHLYHATQKEKGRRIKGSAWSRRTGICNTLSTHSTADVRSRRTGICTNAQDRWKRKEAHKQHSRDMKQAHRQLLSRTGYSLQTSAFNAMLWALNALPAQEGQYVVGS
eukprot:scaffold253420_cov22-Tisochrysis_lutea.AAC.3